MYTHKTLKQNYNGGYALHHTRVHTLLHTPYPAREGMRVWGMEHPSLLLLHDCYVTVGVGIVCLCQSATIIHLIGLSGRRVPPGRACALLSELGPPFPLTFTRYCCCLNCMVYGIRRESRGGGRILRKRRAIVLQSCEQCRWAGQYQND